MDNPQQYVDEATFKWTVGGLVTLLVGMLGVVWSRINGAEVRQDKREEVMKQQQQDGDNSLWAALNVSNRDLQIFKEDTLKTLREVPTRKDLEAMEARIMQAILAKSAPVRGRA